MASRLNSLFISHGGGPLPLLGDKGHAELVTCLEKISSDIQKPDAIIVVSAHWEEQRATITSGSKPSLIYDYYGFPEESYEIQYPCEGNPSLAQKLHELLSGAGIDSVLDDTRGFDHGLFIPLKIMFPDADIPCVQLSLVTSLDPDFHIAIGEVLNQLHDENVLILGSGFSFHNMKAFFTEETEQNKSLNHEFESWLITTCCNTDYSEEQRKALLVNWQEAPGARYCHPREEHLLPLHVCYGAAKSAATCSYELTILNKKSSMYLWSNN